MENEIIDAEYSEVADPTGGLCEITAEIKYISDNMRKVVIDGIIEIGRRFEKAKALVKHGEWGDWCENCTGYSQSMAENYIKVYKEYGSDQGSLFGDLSKSQSIGNLGVTKLVALAALPADERLQFVEDNNITEETTVKELQEKLKQRDSEVETAQSRAASAEEKEKELTATIERNEATIKDKKAEIKRLKDELAARKAEKPTVPKDEMEKLMAEADERAKASLQSEIDRLQAENENAAAENEELKNKLLRANNEATFGSDENIIRLNLCFEDAQRILKDLKGCLDSAKDNDKYDTIRGAVLEVMDKLVGEL